MGEVTPPSPQEERVAEVQARTPLFTSTPIALDATGFTMSKLDFQESHPVRVKNRFHGDSTFNLKAGPLQFGELGEHRMQETLLLEIEASQSYRAHVAELPGTGFGSHLCYDYAEAANRVADEFCTKNGFNRVHHLSSWPKFQAVVWKDQDPADVAAATRADALKV